MAGMLERVDDSTFDSLRKSILVKNDRMIRPMYEPPMVVDCATSQSSADLRS